MARMPDLFREAEEAVFGHLPGRHHHTSAAPAAATATIRTSNPGGPVSLLTEAKTILHDGLARLESLDETVAAKAEAVAANPETAQVLDVLHELTGLNVAPGLVSIVASGLTELATRLKAAASSTATPAGPQVAGQA